MTVSETRASNASRTIAYECPHCGAANSVDPAAIGEIVTCLNDDCGQVFRVDAPAGHQIHDDAPRVVGVVEPPTNHPDSTVSETEQELLTLHPSTFGNQPFSFLGSVLLVIGGIVGAVVARDGLILMSSGLVLAAAGAVLLAYWWIQTLFRFVTVTTKRTIYRQGIFSKLTSEVQHDDVRNMQVEQSFFDRILGIWHLAVSSSGQDDMEIDVRGLNSPQRVIDIIREYQ